ncbi:DNA polymerase processivity factor component A20 [Buffalopox virus]|uniref:Viral DNA polymerase processivity factor n=1 Tax=Buffalopox virus TaxID=32605 RepID=A0A2P1JPU7_VACCV|nr:viral DNA polymerase processivity factor [Buffalopox virus]QCY54022.1 viral DNA polymerase processivity factor [Buffalopox virus]QCY54184.1 viral DNA polymerase processivity factor [Buffalopox virus]QCY54342.1 viral DNA polymerase processivity factor [Buffalopox virus]UJQ44652.1 DNA polymerase processivity factor component A20 [Buffalopox virus]
MTSSADLTNLKELLSLYKSLRFSDSAAIEKYNSLVEWGTSTYWKIGVQKVANVETSISDYYDEVKNKPFNIDPGYYIFLPVYFGSVFIYSKGKNMVELGSGNSFQIPDDMRSACNKVLDSDNGIDFLRFVLLNNRWIMEDAISKYQSPVNIFKLASEYGLNIPKYLEIEIEEDTLFNDELYSIIERSFDDKFPKISISYIKLGELRRQVVDFFKFSFVYIESIKVDRIGNNIFIPSVITKSGKKILVKDVDHLIRSKVREHTFVKVKKKNTFSILYDYDGNGTETRGEVIKRIIDTIGRDYYVNGKYFSKVGSAGLKQLTNKLDINECATVDELVDEINKSGTVKRKIKNQSAFDLSRECLGYPEADFITLVNNMRFKIENCKVVNFNIENTNCLNNPSIETIYGNFNQFVSIFNIVTDVKKRLFE